MNSRNILRELSNGALFDALHRILTTRFGDLPDSGIIAGQSVASACLSLIGLDAPMRDLDVFMSVPRNATPEAYALNGFRYTQTDNMVRGGEFTPIIISIQSYSDALLFKALPKFGYSLIFSCALRDRPDVNVVGFHADDASSQTMAMRVISGFDLNLCQIAMDMDSRTVEWTSAFEDFMFTLTLRVIALNTPVHTVFRLLKKQEEMPFLQCDVAGELTLLQQARTLAAQFEKNKDEEDNQYLCGQILSELTFDKYRRFLDQIGDFFTLRRVSIDLNYRDHDIVPENAHNLQLQPVYPMMSEQDRLAYYLMDHNMRLYQALTGSDTIQLTQEKHFFTLDAKPLADDKLAQVEQAKKSHVLCCHTDSPEQRYAAFANILERIVFQSACRETDLARLHHAKAYIEQDILRNPQWQTRYTLLKEDIALMLDSLLSLDPTALRQILPSDLRRITYMLLKHPHLYNVLVKNSTNNSLIRMATAAKHVRHLDKHDLRYVVGLYETESNDLAEFNFPPIDEQGFMPALRDVLPAFIETIKHRTFAPVAARAGVIDKLLAELPKGAQVYELHSQYEFIMRGNMERHCVGGYFNRAAEYETCILTITLPSGETATAEYRISMAYPSVSERLVEQDDLLVIFSLRQVRGKENSDVHPVIYDACLSKIPFRLIDLPVEAQALIDTPKNRRRVPSLLDVNAGLTGLGRRTLQPYEELPFDEDIPF